AVGTGLSLALSTYIDSKRGLGNLLRADLVAMMALYFLLFVEFLFPQPKFDELIQERKNTILAIVVCLCGFGGIAVGRHCVGKGTEKWKMLETQVPPTMILVLFWSFFAVGYFNMLRAVDFDPIEMVQYFFAPRFTEPWGRGRFGDFSTLLY